MWTIRRRSRFARTRGTVTVPGTGKPVARTGPSEERDLDTVASGCARASSATGREVLRAKIDMAHPNMLLRDPIMYRILHSEHHRTGNKWCIYPDVQTTPMAKATRSSGSRTRSAAARVRRAPSAIRLVYRETRDFSEPPVRARAAESDLYDDEQAQAAFSWCRKVS